MPLRSASIGVRDWFSASARGLVDLLFPPRCVSCGSLGSRLCQTCREQITLANSPACRLCGKPQRRAGLCPQCRTRPSDLTEIRCASTLEAPLRDVIHHFKYRNARDMATPLVSLLLECWRQTDWQPDLLIPVPLHRRRRRERGYNQSEILAIDLGKMLGIPVAADEVHRVRYTRPQIELNASERQQNVDGAFRCSDGSLRGKRVLLIDDVCTTGATLRACASVMRQHGQARTIWAMTAAKAGGPSADRRMM